MWTAAVHEVLARSSPCGNLREEPDSGEPDSGEGARVSEQGSGPAAPPPLVEVRRSSRRKRTVTAFRERDTIVVLLPGRMSAREEREWVDQMVRRVLAREARAAGPRGD